MKHLTAYRNEDCDLSLWENQPANRYGLIGATVKDSHEAKHLLGLTDAERQELERNGELYKDIDGVPYAIDLY